MTPNGNTRTETNRPKPLTEERGLQPAKNPPSMPKVKPPKQD